MYREVVNIQSSYYQFGIELGLPLREMEAIKKAFQLDIAQAFTEVLTIWLRHRYNIEKYGPPTWRRLVEAVDSPAGGNNHALAKTIAEHHPIIVKDGGNNHAPASEKTPVNEITHAPAKTIDEHYPTMMVNSSAGEDSHALVQDIHKPYSSAHEENQSTNTVAAKHHLKGR